MENNHRKCHKSKTIISLSITYKLRKNNVIFAILKDQHDLDLEFEKLKKNAK